MSTTFCVFLLTGISHALILHIQIRGTWKRHTDRVGDSKVRVIPQSGPGFKRKKSSAKYLLRARIWRSTCCEAECEPPASGRALAFCAVFLVRLPGSRLFFARAFHAPTNRVAFAPPQPPERSAAPLAEGRGVK